MRRITIALVLCAAGCTHVQLEGAGDKMVRIERATEGVVHGVVAFKDVTKEDCVGQNLATEAERAKCIEKALVAIKASKVGVSAVQAALVTFWELYPILDRKLSEGGKLNAADLAELTGAAAAVVAAYQDLIKEVQEAKR